jgi:hypothetical protein
MILHIHYILKKKGNLEASYNESGPPDSNLSDSESDSKDEIKRFTIEKKG